MNINLHIERLVLNGLAIGSGEAALVQTAVEAELGRLLAIRGLKMSLQSVGAWPSVPVSVIQLTSSRPAQLGQQIAQAVYGGIGQGQSSPSRIKGRSTHVSEK